MRTGEKPARSRTEGHSALSRGPFRRGLTSMCAASHQASFLGNPEPAADSGVHMVGLRAMGRLVQGMDCRHTGTRGHTLAHSPV